MPHNTDRPSHPPLRSNCPSIVSLPLRLSISSLTLLTVLLAVPPIDRLFPFLSSPAIAQTVEDRKTEADRLFEQGKEQFGVSQFREALQSWESALQIYREIGDRQGEGAALGNLGSAYRNLGQYQQAIEFFEQSLAIAQEIGDRRGEGNALGNLGNAYRNLGQSERAIEFLEQHLAIAREIGDRRGEGNALGSLGIAYDNLGLSERAIEFLEQSLAIAREIGDRQGEGAALGNLGSAYRNLGQYERAIELLEQRLAIAREIGDRRGEGNALGNLGIAYRNLGQSERAIGFLEQHLAIAREIGDRRGEGNALGSLGIAYDNLGQYQRAINFYEQSLAIARELGDRLGEGTTLGNLGIAYDNLGQYQQAINFYEQHLATAKAIGDRLGEGTTLGNLGSAYANLGQYEQAIGFYERSLAISRDISDVEGEGRTLGNLGILYQTQGQPELAIAFLKQSVNVREGIRGGLRDLSLELQQSYAESVSDTYRRLADLLLSQGRLLEAEQVLELLKVQEIREFTRGAVLDPQTREVLPPTPAEQAILDEHESLIAFAKTFVECSRTGQCSDEIYDQQEALRQEWNDAVRSFQATVQDNRDVDPVKVSNELSDIARKIIEAQPDTVLLYPVVLPDKLWVLWVTEGGIANPIEVPVTEAEIAQVMLEFRQLMRDCESENYPCDTAEDIEAIQTVSQKLYNWLIPPQLEQELEQNEIKNLVFALDRSIRYIPMAALFDGKQYLIENYMVSTVTSAGLTGQDNPLPPGSDTAVLALGLSEAVPPDPTVGMPEFSALQYVPDELSAIVRSDSTAISGIYRGLERLNQDFDQKAFRSAPTHQILHIATHGLFVPNNFDSSFLVLGTKTPLQIADIQNMDTYFGDLSLVVLSACETALGAADEYTDGTLPDGREISSIAQTFIEAGADTVVASLWQVNDRATSELMQHFYRQLSESTEAQRIPIAQALQQAQLQLLQGNADAGESPSRGDGTVAVQPLPGSKAAVSPYSHPYYWSAFVIIGNGL